MSRIYEQMRAELAARKQALETEKRMLLKSADRIAEIDVDLAIIDVEDTVYAAKVSKVETTK